jgi:formamidopyrimidine-DNA glycosylase
MFHVGQQDLIFEDVRRFGGLSLNCSALDRLGPEPLEPAFTTRRLERALAGSKQPIKVRLLDQSVVAGIGNIYANEALFVAGIHPRTPCGELNPPDIRRLRSAIQRTLTAAVHLGSRLNLDFSGASSKNGLFYYGQRAGIAGSQGERFHVYDREGEACRRCGSRIVRFQQGGRSTYSCPTCQRKKRAPKDR